MLPTDIADGLIIERNPFTCLSHHTPPSDAANKLDSYQEDGQIMPTSVPDPIIIATANVLSFRSRFVEKVLVRQFEKEGCTM